METQSDRNDTPNTSEEASAKKAYSSPQLVDYGSLTTLTQGGSGFEFEGLSGMNGMN